MTLINKRFDWALFAFLGLLVIAWLYTILAGIISFAIIAIIANLKPLNNYFTRDLIQSFFSFGILALISPVFRQIEVDAFCSKVFGQTLRTLDSGLDEGFARELAGTIMSDMSADCRASPWTYGVQFPFAFDSIAGRSSLTYVLSFVGLLICVLTVVKRDREFSL